MAFIKLLLHILYKKNVYDIIQNKYYERIIAVRNGVIMTGFLVIIFMLLLIIVMLIGLAVAQIKMAGMKVKDFWTFIKANETLNKLYAFSKKYEKLTTNEQLVFLKEAERVFDAFDKVPNVLWEEDYQKYMEVLSTYKDIKLVRWESN